MSRRTRGYLSSAHCRYKLIARGSPASSWRAARAPICGSPDQRHRVVIGTTSPAYLISRRRCRAIFCCLRPGATRSYDRRCAAAAANFSLATIRQLANQSRLERRRQPTAALCDLRARRTSSTRENQPVTRRRHVRERHDASIVASRSTRRDGCPRRELGGCGVAVRELRLR